MRDRLCLKCKGSRFVYNYRTYRYTDQRCECCENGRVPFASSDDGYGPINVTQHIRTTDLKQGEKVVGFTSDVRDEHIPIEEATVRLTGIFTIAELEGMASLLRKLRESGSKISCNCCKYNMVDSYNGSTLV